MIWRLIGETAERACMLVSVSPEGQFRSKLSVLFSVWAGKTHSFKEFACCCGLGNKGQSMKGMTGVAFAGCLVCMSTGLLRLCA